MYGIMRYNCRIMSAWVKKQRENVIFCCTFETDSNWGDFVRTYWVTISWHHAVHGVEKDDSADKLVC